MDMCANEWKEIEKLEKEVERLSKTLILRNDELLKARDALRWRKYPEEKPEINGVYVIATEGLPMRLMDWDNATQRWLCLPKGEIYYWLPIPPGLCFEGKEIPVPEEEEK